MRRKAKRRPVANWLSEPQLSSGSGNDMPPISAHVKIYFSQKGMTEAEADAFFNEYHKRHWKSAQGTPVKNWKAMASDWIFDKKQYKRLRQRKSLFS